MTAVFILATLLPYVIAVRMARGRGEESNSTDRRRFEVMVLGTGGLYAILHALAFTGFLSVPAVAVAGAIGVFVTRGGFRGKAAADAGAASSSHTGAPPGLHVTTWTEHVSTVAMAGVCAWWVVRSVSGLDVAGTDAAHYHLPHAVNYALGASPWGPMPTRHGYPMGTSLLFAWFILPFRDAFIVDVSMVVWYLFLVTSLAALFRLLTGLSGWTWTPWLVLVLFRLRLIQASALPSADLPYAASFVAVSAQLTWMVRGGAPGLRDWAVLGASLGLLIGCKAPGVYSAAALVAAAGAAQFASRRHGTPLQRPSWPAALAVVLGAGLLTGGIWLVRNAWLFGQPVEIYTDRFYLSVLQDVRTVYGGDWLYASWRAGIKIGKWLAPHFLATGAAIVWLCLESALLAARGRAEAVDAVRLWFVGLMLLVAGTHVAGLVGAPWTSLEWTDGASLRYLLPFWILYAFLACAGLFSRLLPWHRHAVVRTAVWLLVAAAAAWGAVGLDGPGGFGLGADRLPALAAAAAILVVGAIVTTLGRQPPVPARPVLAAVRIGVVVLAAVGSAAWLDSRHATLRAAAVREESDTLGIWMAAASPTGEPHRQVYLDVRADELSQGRSCRRRRFFVASRFDLPLALQPATFTSLVFDSRSVALVLPLLRQGAGQGVCDYAVVGREETTREAIRSFSAPLRPIDTAGRYLIYEVVRPSANSGHRDD